MARAAGCDRTYLSQVLGGKAQLTVDHALGLSDYFNFLDAEEDFFIRLVLLERAVSPKAKEKLKLKIETLASENLTLSHSLATKASSPNKQMTEDQFNQYYSNPNYAAVHIATSVPNLSSVEKLASRLRLENKTVHDILDDLIKMGLVKQSKNGFRHSETNLHIPKGSPLTSLQHINWRNKATSHMASKESVHYTSVFAISQKDFQTLKSQILEFIQAQRKDISASGAEDIFCFCCDFFKV